MANVMLNDTIRDPNRPFRFRVEDVCSQFDVVVTECLHLLQSEEQSNNAGGEDQIVRKLEHFNSVLDELYKEILRRKESLLSIMESNPKNVDQHRQIQVAGNLVRLVADLRNYLETGLES